VTLSPSARDPYPARMTDGLGGALHPVPITLYTDAFVVKGQLDTRHHRLSDVLNESTDGFLVLADARFDAYRSAANLIHADFAQVNLASVLFVVTDEAVEPDPLQAIPRVTEQAMIAIPPFSITGRIHLQPERPLREALGMLHGAFVPVTDATYRSDSLGEARTSAVMVPVNHSRCQILAPHHEVDPWAGLGMTGAAPSDETVPTESGQPPTPENLGW
jgi:hypothetical protein